jgi:peptidoglycan/xylan/chitin deacetylase (PgdA/CDA1 family)
VKSEGLKLQEIGKLVGEPFPVLSFGSISVPQEPQEKKWAVSPERFLRMMRILDTLGYRCIDPTENLSLVVAGRRFVLTFEGYEDFYFEVFPNIERLNLKPLVFLPLDYLGRTTLGNVQTGYLKRKVLSVERVAEMRARGVHFGCSGLTYSWLPSLSNTDLRREVVDSKARLEDLLGSEVCCFAYPGGGVDSRVRAEVARAGYKFGYSSRPGLNLWEDRLVLKRTTICECDTALDLVLKVATGRSVRGTLAPLMRSASAACA